MLWRMFWAIVLIVVGVVFLLMNLNILPGDAWNYIFPAILIVLGTMLLLGWKSGAQPLPVVNASASLDGAARAEISLKHGAGRLNVQAGSDAALLFAGTFGGGVDKKMSRMNDTAFLELKTPSDIWSRGGFPFERGLEWNLGLNPGIPLALKYEGGAAETKMDLSGLKLSSLEINTGASSTDVALPAPTGTERVVVHSGAASVKLRLPPNAAATIRGTMGLGSMDVDKTRFPDHGFGVYQSDNYSTSSDRIEMTIEGGVGSVEIH